MMNFKLKLENDFFSNEDNLRKIKLLVKVEKSY